MAKTQTTSHQHACQWGRCTRRALYMVTEQIPNGTIDGTTTEKAMCSQHRIATRNEGWSYGAIVRWARLETAARA